jgi:dolichyl-phosphate-mannose--protein O-mannosyl transferase
MISPPTSDSPFTNRWKLTLLILLLATVTRLWGAFDLNEYIEDETLHVSDAISISTYGTTANWGWHHPQLSGLIMHGTMQIFGDNPVGWRSGNILTGTASVALLMLIGNILYPGSAVPLIAAALLALDPHNIYLSRTTFIEIPVTFFFLLYLYLFLEYVENNRPTLPFAGLALGLTISTKAYFVFAIPLVAVYAAFRLRQRRQLTGTVIVDFVVTLILLPIAVYLLSYGKWFARGHTLPELLQMKRDAVWALQQLSGFVNKEFLEAGGTPGEWFTKPLVWGHQRLMGNGKSQFLLQTNNFPFRLLVLPALCIASVFAWKRNRPQELLAPLLFVSCYLLILLAQRPMFSYSSTVLLPFAYLALARAVTLFAEKTGREMPVYSCFFAAILIWGAYMFPLVSARVVSPAPFRPILSIVRCMWNF